jgi:hypothetical protein
VTKIILPVLAALCAGAMLTGEVVLVRLEHTELDALQLRQADLQQELTSLQKNNAADATRLAALKTSAQQKPIASSAQETDSSRRIEADTQAWLDKVARLKQILAEHPEQKVPEMDKIELRDWLGAIQSANLDSDETVRKTLADLRLAAKQSFTRNLASALTKYLKAYAGELPPTSSALAPFLANPADAPLLDRYKMVKAGNAQDILDPRNNPEHRAIAALLEIAPVDEDYDYRAGVNLGRMGNTGEFAGVQGGTGVGPTAWIENYDTRLKQARADYARDHNGQKATGFAQVAPYFSPALPPATVDKIVAQQQVAKKGP